MATRQQIEPSVGVKVIYSSTYTYQELLNNNLATWGDIIIESKSSGGGLLHIYDASFYFSGYDNGDGDSTNQDGYVLTTRLNTGDVQITGGFTGNSIKVGEIEGNSLVTTDENGDKIVLANIIYDDDLGKYVIDCGDNAILKSTDVILNEDSLNEIIKQLQLDIAAAPVNAYNLVSQDLLDINKRITDVTHDLSTSILNAEISAGIADASLKNYVDKNDASLSKDIVSIGETISQTIHDVSSALIKEDTRLDTSIKELIQQVGDLDKQYDNIDKALAKTNERLDNSVNILTRDVSTIQEYIKSGVTDEKMREYVDASILAIKQELQDGDKSVYNSLYPSIQEVSSRVSEVSGNILQLQQHVDLSIHELSQQISQQNDYSYSTTGHTITDTKISDISTVKEAIDVLLENCYYTEPDAIQASFEVSDCSYIVGDSEPVIFTFSIANYDAASYQYTYSNPDELQESKTFNGITSFGAYATPNTDMTDLVRTVKIEYIIPDEHGNTPAPFESTLTSTAKRMEFYAQSNVEKTVIHDIQQMFYDTQQFIIGKMGIYCINDIKVANGEYFYIAVYSHDGLAPVLDTDDYSQSIEFTYVDTISFNYGTCRGAYDVYKAQITTDDNYILSYKKQASSGGGGEADLYWEDI